MRKFGFSWSWKRASGLSAAKGRISRKIGIPLTRSGRERKIGRMMGLAGLGLLGIGSRQAATSDEPAEENGGGGCCGCLFLLIILVIGVIIAIGLSSPSGNKASAPTPSAKQESPDPPPPPAVAPDDRQPSPETSAPPVPDPAPTPDPIPTPSPKMPPVRETRTWKDTSGQFTTSARLKSVANGKVRLIKEDGSEIVVPKERLSDDDQAYIKAQMK